MRKPPVATFSNYPPDKAICQHKHRNREAHKHWDTLLCMADKANAPADDDPVNKKENGDVCTPRVAQAEERIIPDVCDEPMARG